LFPIYLYDAILMESVGRSRQRKLDSDHRIQRGREAVMRFELQTSQSQAPIDVRYSQSSRFVCYLADLIHARKLICKQLTRKIQFPSHSTLSAVANNSRHLNFYDGAAGPHGAKRALKRVLRANANNSVIDEGD
jgi:hypothetical protein